MYCTNCGKQNPKSSNFCQHCGIKISHTRITGTTVSDNVDQSFAKTPKTNSRMNKIASGIIGILVIVILILSIWLANFYRQEVNHILMNMKSLIVPSQSVAESGWIQFDDPHGRFSAYLPSDPEVKKYTFEIQGESMTGYTYISQINNDDYIEIKYIDDPTIAFDSDANATLDRVMNSYLININGIIIDGDNTTFLNYPAFEYRASVDKGKVYIKSLIFIKNNEIYMLNEYDKTGIFPGFEKFRNYFDLN